MKSYYYSLDFFLDGLLLPHQPAQLLLFVLQLLLHVVHLLTILVYLLVSLQQLLVQLLNFSLIMVEFEELQLDTGSGDFVFQALITLGLEKEKDGIEFITLLYTYIH